MSAVLWFNGFLWWIWLSISLAAFILPPIFLYAPYASSEPVDPQEEFTGCGGVIMPVARNAPESGSSFDHGCESQDGPDVVRLAFDGQNGLIYTVIDDVDPSGLPGIVEYSEAMTLRWFCRACGTSDMSLDPGHSLRPLES
jgi:hypothetical protein